MKFFPDQIYAAIHEKDKAKHVVHFSRSDDQRFRQLNQQGYGIYVTANSFNGARKKQSLLKLNAVVGDLDVAKDSGDTTEETREECKLALIEKLNKYCPPSWTVITKNGIQPWYLIDEDKRDENTLKLYEGVMCGLIDVSKGIGGLGDETKDVSRLWRVPGYVHNKSAPFDITEIPGNGHVWELEDLREFFWREPKNTHASKGRTYSPTSDIPLWRELSKIDIKDVVIRAGIESGRDIHFGRDGHMVLNGERRGTFIGTGGDFIATQSSVDPIKGNRVTVVANMLKIPNGEAVVWLCNTYDKDPRWKLYG